jgi:ring-1,2-phenylacetyl-CoA epoxidase subunit PaaD
VVSEAASLRERAIAAAAQVVDPEIPVLSIVDLGVLRDVRVEGESVRVLITPTYSGCPAMRMIELSLDAALRAAGIEKFRIDTVLSPAWTTDWLSEEGRRKLREFGIAPPAGTASRRALFGADAVTCPRCGSAETERIAEFGSTACKALYRCHQCREPFDYFKCH